MSYYTSTAPGLMNLIFVVLYVSQAMGLTGCYKSEFFLHLHLQFFCHTFAFAISVTYSELND